MSDEGSAAGEQSGRQMHYTTYVQVTLEGGRLEEPVNEVRRILCGFCGDLTEPDSPRDVLYLRGTLVDGSRWVGLGAHVRCLTAAVHPRIADGVAQQLGHM